MLLAGVVFSWLRIHDGKRGIKSNHLNQIARNKKGSIESDQSFQLAFRFVVGVQHANDRVWGMKRFIIIKFWPTSNAECICSGLFWLYLANGWLPNHLICGFGGLSPKVGESFHWTMWIFLLEIRNLTSFKVACNLNKLTLTWFIDNNSHDFQIHRYLIGIIAMLKKSLSHIYRKPSLRSIVKQIPSKWVECENVDGKLAKQIEPQAFSQEQQRSNTKQHIYNDVFMRTHWLTSIFRKVSVTISYPLQYITILAPFTSQVCVSKTRKLKLNSASFYLGVTWCDCVIWRSAETTQSINTAHTDTHTFEHSTNMWESLIWQKMLTMQCMCVRVFPF